MRVFFCETQGGNLDMVCIIWRLCIILSLSYFSVGQGKKYAVQIEPVVGELLRPIYISEQGFLALQGVWPSLSIFTSSYSPPCREAERNARGVRETEQPKWRCSFCHISSFGSR